jgi:hypothetical protein
MTPRRVPEQLSSANARAADERRRCPRGLFRREGRDGQVSAGPLHRHGARPGDFCDRCAAFPELAGALQDGLFVVVPMTESELRVAITGPAQAAGLRIDPALTETILGICG